MAVVSCNLKYGTGSGSATAEDGRIRNEFPRVYVVVTDDPLNEADVILLSSLVPKVGDTYATPDGLYVGIYCQNIQVERDTEVETLWEVTAEFANIKPDTQEDNPTNNPLLRPTKIWWTFRREEAVFPADRRGNWYRNAAGDPLENPPATPYIVSILNIKKNVASYDSTAIAAYQDAVNTDTWLGFEPGYGKLAVTPSEPQTENDVVFCEMITQVEFSPLPWHPQRLLNQGPRYRDADGNMVQADTDGVHTDRDILLAADGTKLADDAEPTVLERYPYPEIAYASLGWLLT